MKAFLTVFILLASAGFLFGQTSFCVTVNDACCDGNESTGSFQMGERDAVIYYYIHFETPSKADKVTVRCTLDDTEVWSKTDLCGCGDITVWYPTGPDHLIEFYVKCDYCSMPPCQNGTALVNIYTPSSTICAPDCEIE